MEHPNRWVMKEPGYGRSPVVCSGSKGRFWVAWISWIEGGECIRVSYRDSGKDWEEPFCTETRPLILGLDIAPYGDGALVSWIDGNDPVKDGLKLASVGSDGFGKARLVTPGANIPAHPSLSSYECADHGTRFALAWSERNGFKREIKARSGVSESDFGDEMRISLQASISARPDVVCNESGAVVVWQHMDGGSSRIMSRVVGSNGQLGEVLNISPENDGIAALPNAANGVNGGTWIAWQSDWSEESGAGLVRWVELAHLGEDGRITRPREPMPGSERKEEGEDQGFEAPSLNVLEDGRLVIIGRGSQSIRRQDLGAGGWSEFVQVDETGWQCRGRRFDSWPVSGGVLVAGRERSEVVVRLLDSGDTDKGGAPEPAAFVELAKTETSNSAPAGFDHIIAGHRIIFGDIHQHTSASDGTGTAEETFLRARYRYGDDMTAIADHESFLGKRTPPGEWALTCLAADEAYRPGAFVTLHAFEWTGKMHPGPGHKVVYLPANGGPVLSRDDDASRSSRGLIKEARAHGALVFPHHVGWTGADLGAHNPEIQTCFEIVSCHGAYERQGVGPIGFRGNGNGDQFAAAALDMGHRFGFVGGSDGHGLNRHHGVCRKLDSHRTGLTAVFPNEASRQGVLEALKRRRCYATSGAKIYLWFEVDDRPMGEEIISSEPLSYRVLVSGTETLQSVCLVTNQGVETALECDGRRTDVRGTIPPPNPEDWRYYFVRAIQADGEMAWSSPIWLDSPQTA